MSVLDALERAIGDWTDDLYAIRLVRSPHPPRRAQQEAETASIEADAALLRELREALADGVGPLRCWYGKLDDFVATVRPESPVEGCTCSNCRLARLLAADLSA
jgi:hypothetical protein